MRKTVVLLGIVTALAFVAPAIRPAPALAADTATTTVDGGAWRMIFEVIKKLSLEAYMIVDRLMDGSRGNNNGCACGGAGCGCCRGGAGTPTSGGTTGVGGTGGSTPPGAPPDSTP